MHFRARYGVRDIGQILTEIRIPNAGGNIRVHVTKRAENETYPPFEPLQAVATAFCERDIPEEILREATSSGNLSSRSEGVCQANGELTAVLLRTIRLIQWRSNCPTSGHNPIHWGPEFRWSFDGEDWQDYFNLRPAGLRCDITVFGLWKDEDTDFVRKEILGDLDEPLAHELLREAVANRKGNPRSSLVLAVAAAEVGFKQFASETFPDSGWILEKLQSPSLETMMKVFPWSKLGLAINGKPLSVPNSTKTGLKKAIELRNKVAHVGIAKLEIESIESAITSSRDLLYFLDAVRGQGWALNHLSPDALKSFS